MSSTKDNTDEQSILEIIQEYLAARKNLVVLQTVDKLSHAIAIIIVMFIISAFAVISLLFLGITIGFLLAEKTGSFFGGFLIVAVFYLAVTLILVLIRKKTLQKPLINAFIKYFLK